MNESLNPNEKKLAKRMRKVFGPELTPDKLDFDALVLELVANNVKAMHEDMERKKAERIRDPSPFVLNNARTWQFRIAIPESSPLHAAWDRGINDVPIHLAFERLSRISPFFSDIVYLRNHAIVIRYQHMVNRLIQPVRNE